MNKNLFEERPEDQLQVHRWHEMSAQELNKQLDILTGKLTLLHSMLGMSPTQTMIDLYKSHQQALQHLNTLIEMRLAGQGSTRIR